MTPEAGTRVLKTRHGRAIEAMYVPEAASAARGTRVWFGPAQGCTGIHEGDGRVRIFGEGEYYGYRTPDGHHAGYARGA